MRPDFHPLPTPKHLKKIKASIDSHKQATELTDRRINLMLQSITKGVCINCGQQCPKWPPEHLNDTPANWHICQLNDVAAFIICKKCFHPPA